MAQRRKLSTGWTIFGVVLVIGLVVTYWYVAVPIAVVLGVVGLVHHSKNERARREQQRRQEEAARHRPGPRDPWLNEIAVALADFEFTEFARNTGTQLAGIPLEGDIRLDAPRFSVVISLFPSAELARQAEIALRARPEVRGSIADGRSMVRAEDRVLYSANGLGGVVDESRLDEVVEVVKHIPIGLPRVPPAAGLGPGLSPMPANTWRASTPHAMPVVAASQGSPASGADILDQIKRLAELRDAGALTDAEFEAKKAELLRRL